MHAFHHKLAFIVIVIMCCYSQIDLSYKVCRDFSKKDGAVIREFAPQSVDLGYNPLVESYQNTLKMVSTVSLLGDRRLEEVVANKPASSLAVSLGKALNGTPPPLCEKQVAQKPRKWQLPSECGRPVQNIAIQFAFL